MTILQKGVAAASDHLPKVMSPRTHAIADIAIIGSFATMGALFWKKHRRAAVASLVCAGCAAANTLLTDFPGGVTGALSFRTHSRIEAMLASSAAALPGFLAFEEHIPGKFFRAVALGITVISAVTATERRQLERMPARRTA